jgi:hypothetical protein
MQIDIWFIVLFIIMWALGPATQVLQLIAPQLHYKLGLMEKAAFEPEFKWFRLNERGTAYADLTHFCAGIAFVWLAIVGNETALVFGLYTCSVYLFVMTQYLVQLVLLTSQNLHPVSKDQIGFYVVYAGLFIAFGLYGLFYLWAIASA